MLTHVYGSTAWGSSEYNAPPAVKPAGIAPAVAFGTPTWRLRALPAGIAPAVTFGTFTFGGYAMPSGITPHVTFGAPAFSPKPLGITPHVTFGTPSIVQKIAPVGIGPAVTFGTPTVVVGRRIDEHATWGTSQWGLDRYGRSGLIGISPNVTFGVPIFKFAQAVSPAGIAPAVTFGSPHLGRKVKVDGIPPSVAFGTPALPLGVPTDAFFGDGNFGDGYFGKAPAAHQYGLSDWGGEDRRQFVAPLKSIVAGIAPAVAFGTPRFRSTINPTGIAPNVGFGSPINFMHFVNPAGIPARATIGTPTLSTHSTVTPTAISAHVTFGTIQFPQRISVAGIGPHVVFGQLGRTTIVGIGPAVTFGTPTLSNIVLVAGHLGQHATSKSMTATAAATITGPRATAELAQTAMAMGG